MITDAATQVVPLEKSPRNPYDGFLFLGRASTCDIIIRDASISKTHAVIEPLPGTWHLRDKRSRNGTWRNGERLKENDRVEASRAATSSSSGRTRPTSFSRRT